MTGIGIDTKRKLREMGAAPLLEAIEAQHETLVLGAAFDERLRLVVDEAHSAFNHSKVDGLIRRAGLRYPGADLRRLDRVNRRPDGPVAYLRVLHLRRPLNPAGIPWTRPWRPCPRREVTGSAVNRVLITELIVPNERLWLHIDDGR